MSKLLLLINTVKYLKWEQIFFRLVRKFFKPKVTDVFNGLFLKRSVGWVHFTLYEEKINKHLKACLLNHSKQLDFPTDWNNEDMSKLWVYNLHYFEDLLSYNADEKSDIHLQLLKNWIDQNQIGYGNGWEPYPLSLRIVNILKAWIGGLEISDKVFESLHSQASYLFNDTEKYLLGNHYFVNLKALLFAGVIFKNLQWVNSAENGLIREIPEQILQDGANFELSPMYHSLILLDMLDMYNLSKAYPGTISSKLISLLKDYIPKMLLFMEAMSHPDGGVSFFNDSSGGIAPTKTKIENYAKKLGFSIYPLNHSELRIIDNANSGYICATVAGNKLIFDASPIGPDYIPGHAHADTLSFELSIATQRVFVNSGTSEYGLNQKRLAQRKTASHNTVEVNGKDSSQVWSSFRVANRARILSRLTEVKRDHSILLESSHNGYKSLFGGCIHTRRLNFSKDSLVITDLLQGKFKHAKSRFYFHPDLTVNLENNLLKVEGPKFILHSDLTGKAASLVNSSWYPEFGLELSNKALEVKFNDNQIEILFAWVKR